ncbi:hypothetical protein CHS0354_003863 [Potamilus streckersoni]|uniref:Uncharacterized protein n=1 Tax=Potamilus streckersoni TaxID=2493646 RepID=A0AAE0SFT2_9BIVA|nr:hypothetical protein CHS0354_003863 [Potamilus streckersoni]
MPPVNQWEDLTASIVAESQQHDITVVNTLQATSSKSVLPEKGKSESGGKVVVVMSLSFTRNSPRVFELCLAYHATSPNGAVLWYGNCNRFFAGVIAGSVVGSVVLTAFTLYASAWIFR